MEAVAQRDAAEAARRVWWDRSVISSAHGVQAAVAMGAAWQTVDASAAKGGRAAIVHIVTSDLAAMLVRRPVTQRALARATDGATRMVGAIVAIRSQESRA